MSEIFKTSKLVDKIDMNKVMDAMRDNRELQDKILYTQTVLDSFEKIDIKDNKIELLEEDLECVHLYLDSLNVPRKENSCQEYSIVGRIKYLLSQKEKQWKKKK